MKIHQEGVTHFKEPIDLNDLSSLDESLFEYDYPIYVNNPTKDNEINTANYRILVKAVEVFGGDVNRLFTHSYKRHQPGIMTHPKRFISSIDAIFFHDCVRQLLAENGVISDSGSAFNPRFHMELGHIAGKHQSMGKTLDFLAQFVPMKKVYPEAVKYGRYFNNTELYKCVYNDNNTAIITHKYFENYKRYYRLTQNNWSRGIMAGIPAARGLEPSDSRIDYCLFPIFEVLKEDFKYLNLNLDLFSTTQEEVNGAMRNRYFYGDKEFAHDVFLEKIVISQEKKRVGGKRILYDHEVYDIFPKEFEEFQKQSLEQSLAEKMRATREAQTARKNEAVARELVEELKKAKATIEDHAQNLEAKVEERTKELRETQAKLIETEKRTLEHRITGGFAHEMRNALAGAQLEFKTTLNYKDQGKPSAEILKEFATTLLKNVADLHSEFNIPREKIATLLLPELKAIAEIADHLKDVISDVSSDLDRGLSITTQIRDYAKMSEMKPGDEAVDIGFLLRSYKDRYKLDFERIGITYAVEGPETVVVKADEVHINSIFSNLILNAKDALEEVETGQAKEIKVTVDKRDDESENLFVITVADNGPGIPEENLKEIFEPFYSTKPTTGTGLGLGVVKRLVQLYGGTIEVESKADEGSAFSVALPCDT